jgi:ATP-dependent DNA helicase RecG
VDAVLRRHDLDRYDDRENIRCNLIETYDKLINFVAKHLPDKFYLEGDQRISLREKIFREIIANMLIHREYSNAYPSSFVIYSNRVETKNANKPIFIGQLLPGKFEPFPKNPNIAQIFTQMGRSEELGTGVKNVFKYSKAYSGSDHIVFEENDVFVAKVPLSDAIYNTDDHAGKPEERIDGELNEGLTTLIKAILKNPGIQSRNLSTLLNIRPIKTIERQISELTQQKLIERRGSKKTGGYFSLK